MTANSMVRNIVVCGVMHMENHAANRGDKAFGNASTVKRLLSGEAYLSGQKMRHALFEAIRDAVSSNPQIAGNDFVSHGDGVSGNIERDIRADLGGFMLTKGDGNYAERRNSPTRASYAKALQQSHINRDLLIRLKHEASDQKQALVNNEFSESDDFVFNFGLDLAQVGAKTTEQYDPQTHYHVGTVVEDAIGREERLRRALLFLEGTQQMTAFSNQARQAVCGEPVRVLIVLSPRISNKPMGFFGKSEVAQPRILSEIEARGGCSFWGDDDDESRMSVYEAYQSAADALRQSELPDVTALSRQLTLV